MLHNDGFRFVLAVLATWRLTHLFVAEDGPADVIVRLRRLLGDSTAGRAMDCFHCLSMWFAAPLAFTVGRSRDTVLVWLALSGGACLLERIGSGRQTLSASFPAVVIGPDQQPLDHPR